MKRAFFQGTNDQIPAVLDPYDFPWRPDLRDLGIDVERYDDDDPEAYPHDGRSDGDRRFDYGATIRSKLRYDGGV